MGELASRRMVFGLAVPETHALQDVRVGSLIRWIGARAGVELVRFQVPSYEALARQMVDGALHVAWLPPIVFVRLEREGIALPLVTNQRGASRAYQCVLLVRRSSAIHSLEALRGASAAWVDPMSASGYVMPRLQLAAVGLDPRTLFGVERFYGSHTAAVAALIDGAADVAATFAAADPAGPPSIGSWRADPGVTSAVRVLTTFGEIPADLIAVRNDVDPASRAALAAAFSDACRDETMAPIAQRVFGVDGFEANGFEHYDGLRASLDAAADRGLLDVALIHSSRLPTRPPGPVR
jgi:phosphate/phosphite/phosphonate ABC transporter binding protein